MSVGTVSSLGPGGAAEPVTGDGRRKQRPRGRSREPQAQAPGHRRGKAACFPSPAGTWESPSASPLAYVGPPADPALGPGNQAHKRVAPPPRSRLHGPAEARGVGGPSVSHQRHAGLAAPLCRRRTRSILSREALLWGRPTEGAFFPGERFAGHPLTRDEHREHAPHARGSGVKPTDVQVEGALGLEPTMGPGRSHAGDKDARGGFSIAGRWARRVGATGRDGYTPIRGRHEAAAAPAAAGAGDRGLPHWPGLSVRGHPEGSSRFLPNGARSP